MTDSTKDRRIASTTKTKRIPTGVFNPTGPWSPQYKQSDCKSPQTNPCAFTSVARSPGFPFTPTWFYTRIKPSCRGGNKLTRHFVTPQKHSIWLARDSSADLFATTNRDALQPGPNTASSSLLSSISTQNFPEKLTQTSLARRKRPCRGDALAAMAATTRSVANRTDYLLTDRTRGI